MTSSSHRLLSVQAPILAQCRTHTRPSESWAHVVYGLLTGVQDGHELGLSLGSTHVPRGWMDIPVGGHIRCIRPNYGSKRVVSTDLESSLQFFCHPLLWGSHCTGNPVPEPRALSLPFDAHHFQQTGLVNCRQVKKLPRPVTAIIAGSAPTAHLIASLEKLGIIPVHVYGLTSVLPFLSFNLPNRLSSSQRGKLRPCPQRGPQLTHLFRAIIDLWPIHSQPPATLMAGTSIGRTCKAHGQARL